MTQGSTPSQVKTTGPSGLAEMQAAPQLPSSTHSAQCTPVQQERVTWAALSWPPPSVPRMSPVPRVLDSCTFLVWEGADGEHLTTSHWH